MKLRDAQSNYEAYTGKTSDITRQLGFAGIALIWIFRANSGQGYTIPAELLLPMVLILLALTADYLQYAVSGALWGTFRRYKEVHEGQEAEFLAPRWINWPGITFFFLKQPLMIAAYVFLFRFLFPRLAVGLPVVS